MGTQSTWGLAKGEAKVSDHFVFIQYFDGKKLQTSVSPFVQPEPLYPFGTK